MSTATEHYSCGFCGGAHTEADCDKIFTPIIDCEYQEKPYGTCGKPGWWSAECHVSACPRLNPKLVAKWEIGIDFGEEL